MRLHTYGMQKMGYRYYSTERCIPNGMRNLCRIQLKNGIIRFLLRLP